MFTSAQFVIFLAIAVTLYFAAFGKCRPVLLLLFSYLFCSALSIPSFAVLVLITLFTYFSARLMDKDGPCKNQALRKACAILSILTCIFVLIGYKYLNCFQGFIPIGLSFYLFQSIGYLVDVYQGKYSAKISFLYFGLYLAYFPKFVSGPIERENTFIEQLSHIETIRFWNRGRLSAALTYMLYGYFLKMVIADRLSLIVTRLFEAPDYYNSFFLALGVLFYTIQIYCDFAGYSYLAIGCSKLFGITLNINFLTPYCSRNISEFWRRWHVSLSTWLRDYIYIPLGGSRNGLFLKCLNTMIVFIICGLWHGTGLSFLVWGLLHGLYSIIHTLFKKFGIRLPLCRVITFIEVAFAWIFFRASGLKSALWYICNMMTSGIRFHEFPVLLNSLGMTGIEMAVIIISIFLMIVSDIISYRQNEPFPELIQHMQNGGRYLVFYIMIIALFIFGIYGPGYHSEQFIYMQF
ncbi:MAG: MBOAT family protein [Lachnospiraceae bacterium]|nr:MBOAT family protein [Lachnospiraceae bacterium]